MTKRIKKDQGVEQVRALIKKTDLEKPTQQERMALREALKKDEALWRKASDMNSMAQRLLLDKFPAQTREAIQIRLEAMQNDLGYAESPVLEQLLIEQVVTCWLNFEYIQIGYVTALKMSTDMANANRWEKLTATAQGRHLRAMEALAGMRRRLRPSALQVNIGAQQVNVMGKSEGLEEED